MRVLMYHTHECDSKKCTGMKLIRQGLIEPVRKPDRLRHTVFLDPYARIPLSMIDRPEALKMGLGLIDASWSHALTLHEQFRAKVSRRLPHLIPVNPMNYGHVSQLTSAEAIAGALFILGEDEEARKILGAIQWGPHFEEVNFHLLKQYHEASGPDEIIILEKDVIPL